MTKGIDIVDVNVIEGEWSNDKPCLVIDVETAQKAIEKGVTAELLKQGVASLALSGKQIVVIQGQW